jgi:hypothetical protein
MKKSRVFFLLGSLTLIVGFAACCTPGIIGSQPVTLRPQETGMWCWAASGEMVMEFLGHDVHQCVEANNRFGRTDCCNTPAPNDCVNGGWPEFDKYGFAADITSDAALSWAQVQSQIYCRKEPFAFSWHWNGGGGHMMVATGYVTIDGTNYVSVNNPWPPNQGAQEVDTYDVYVSGSDHTHWNDYYNVRYTK